MRASEFRRAVVDEFGEEYGTVITRDLILADLADRTAEQALAAGVAPKDVWLALCDAAGVPVPRRHGRGRPEPRR